jgi:hypothetical protein
MYDLKDSDGSMRTLKMVKVWAETSTNNYKLVYRDSNETDEG